jgi:putative membrane protein
MYDRFVHFAYGLLLYPFFYRCFEFFFPKSKPVAIFLLVVQFVMASSLVYELIEWWIAIGLSPEDAENYNGQQGDIWDAHKDMFLATLGSDFDWFIYIEETLFRTIEFSMLNIQFEETSKSLNNSLKDVSS